MHQPQSHYYEFGPFRLVTSERILLRGGQFVPLTPKAFETLLVLVEGSGRILDKDDLLRKVWPDTFVEEAGLAKNISILRKVLGEDFNHQYIETIPRRGYRFVAEVREVWQDGAAQSTTQSVPGSQHETTAGEQLKAQVGVGVADPTIVLRQSADPSFLQTLGNSLRWSAVLLSIGLMAGLIVWRLGFRSSSEVTKPPLKGFPLTTFQGRETQVAFSPDGNQIAFVWEGSRGDNPDVYVKLIDSETPLRLTSNPAADTKPAWSPDGRYIAFLRQTTDSSAFYLIPALGGAERKLADIFPFQVPGDGNSPYYSPDGKYLAIPDKGSESEPLGIFLLSVETGEKRRLTTAPAGSLGDYYPAFSPDGKMLAFVRASRWSTDDVYIMPASGGELTRVTFDNLTLTGLTWTPDNQEIMFTSRRSGGIRYLWRVPVTGGTPERVDTIGNDVLSPAISPQGNRLAYTQTLDDINIWRIEVDAAERGVSQREFITSTFWDHGPDYSPDGKKIVFASGRSGSMGIWVCESDGSKPRMLHACGPYVTGTPRWSPDGRWIVFDSRRCAAGTEGNPDIYIMSADGGQPRRLTTELSEDVVPSWSHDGKWVYFASMRSGSMQLWKVPPAGGTAVQVTEHGGFEGFESTDGKYIYYTKGRGIPGIWRAPTAGGKEVLVVNHHQAGLWRYWRVTDRGIFFATAMNAVPLLEFYRFATGQVSEVIRLEKEPVRHIPGLAVSPDGRTVLHSQIDRGGSDIMMVENFR